VCTMRAAPGILLAPAVAKAMADKPKYPFILSLSKDRNTVLLIFLLTQKNPVHKLATGF